MYTPTPTPRPMGTPTPTPTKTAQTMWFRVKLTGVNSGRAEGAKITVKFYLKNGSVQQLSEPLTLTHESGGIYKTSAIITNPLPAGTQFRIAIKGEKHIALTFCRQVGQTRPCKDTEYITVPNPVPLSYGFDFTGIPLPPEATLARIKPLLSKPCSKLTAEEKRIGDVDYSGCVNVRDVFLVL